MNENRVKINYNSSAQKATFQYLNDSGKWVDVYRGSPLSRSKYANAIADGNINELLQTISDTYNRNGNGIEIIFSGINSAFLEVKNSAKDFKSIKVKRQEAKVAIVGKHKSGKTYLAEGIFTFYGNAPKVKENNDYLKYSDDDNGIEIYEIKGIDYGIENVTKTFDTLNDCISNNAISLVFYCFLSKTGRFEDIEIDFIKKLEELRPEIEVIPIITGCVDERNGVEFSNRIIGALGIRDVLIILAKDMNTKVGIIPSFGLDQVIKKMAGGNT